MDPAQDGTNWYAAFGNDPVNYADPSGLTPAFHPLKGFGKGAPGLSPAHRALIASQPLAPPPGSGQYFGGPDINLGVSSAQGTPNLGERPCICGYAADEHLGREKQRGQEQQRGQIVLTPFSTPCLHCPAGFNRAMVHHATRRTTILIREVRMLRVLAIACPLWAAGALLVPRCGVESAIAQTVVATSTTDLPTAEEVLSVIRANQARLNPLHFQCRFIEERTEAYAESKRLQAMGLEKLLESIERGEGVAELEAQAPGISSEAYRQELRDQVETSQELAQPVCFEHHFEFFIDGDNYQVRSPLNSRDVSQKFPAGPLTADALTSEFARIRIYSRSTSQSPPGQIWQGQSNADAAIYATTTSKHFGDSHSTNVPPLTRALRASSHDIHPIDMFL
ncbi:MAG TPA: hypothetical protein VER03_19700, partial [Bryobacteraceae bacterium]|nr:hypothetical protein [Bryobacteraceae bacterium]